MVYILITISLDNLVESPCFVCWSYCCLMGISQISKGPRKNEYPWSICNFVLINIWHNHQAKIQQTKIPGSYENSVLCTKQYTLQRRQNRFLPGQISQQEGTTLLVWKIQTKHGPGQAGLFRHPCSQHLFYETVLYINFIVHTQSVVFLPLGMPMPLTPIKVQDLACLQYLQGAAYSGILTMPF